MSRKTINLLSFLVIALTLISLDFGKFNEALGYGEGGNIGYDGKINAFLENLEMRDALSDTIMGGKILRMQSNEIITPEETPAPSATPSVTPWERAWSAQDIIRLGYVPGEVVVKFKKEAIDLQQAAGKAAAQQFAANNSATAASFALQRLEEKGETQFQSLGRKKGSGAFFPKIPFP